MVKIVALARISNALQTNAPAATGQEARLGDQVLGYRKKKKRWISHYNVVDSRVKGVVVEINGTRRPSVIDKVHLHQKESEQP